MFTRRQFILWRITDGVKLPVSPHTLSVCDAHDRSQWIDFETARAIATSVGCGVAYVFAEDDPYFFLDIDHCRIGNDWSGLANDICSRFPGAFVEVSQSGEGLHIFGRYTEMPPHACKNTQCGLELYHDKRFVALTLNGQGDPNTDCTAALRSVIDQFFKPTGNETQPVPAWTNTPAPEWRGPEDDAELIELACSRNGAGSVFGGRASFRDLWTANVDALSHSYPDGYGSRPYDPSSADAALAQHLAYWTGRNCDRMWRLMYASALRREKWDKRPEYVQRTIITACGRCDKVFCASVTPSSMQQTSECELVPAVPYVTATDQMEMFKGCVYVRDLHRVYTPDGALLRPEQFRTMFGGYLYSTDVLNEKTTKNAWEAFVESTALRWPRVANICFRPECEPGAIIHEEGRKLLNTWQPVDIESRPGDVTPFLNHLHAMLPNERDAEILLSFMASIVQNPGVKFQWAPLLQGCEGNGKTFFITAMEYAVGKKYTHLPNASELGSSGQKFNSWIQCKLFVGVEEIYVSDRREVADALKPLITNARIEIQGKGVDQVTGDNRANFILCTNHKDAIIKTTGDRRYCILYTAQQTPTDMVQAGWRRPTGEATEYFPRLYNWLRAEGHAHITHFLRNMQIRDELNPAVLCHRAPLTSSTQEAIRISMPAHEQEIQEAIDEGRPGFANGWVSSHMLEKLLDERGLSRRFPINRRGQLMSSMGYVLHPALKEGRTTSPLLAEDGKRPKLYIREGHLALNLTIPADVIATYMRDQNYILTPPSVTAITNRK